MPFRYYEFSGSIPLAHIPIAHIHSNRPVPRIFLDHQLENFMLSVTLVKELL